MDFSIDIVVKRERTDKGWIVVQEGRFEGINGNRVYVDLMDAFLAAAIAFPPSAKGPSYNYFLDMRSHRIFGNGLVMIQGLPNYKPIYYVQGGESGKDKGDLGDTPPACEAIQPHAATHEGSGNSTRDRGSARSPRKSGGGSPAKKPTAAKPAARGANNTNRRSLGRVV